MLLETSGSGLGNKGLTMAIWVTSDNHFWHKRIAEYCGRPPDHEERMWAGLAECVQPEDTLIHLGDVSWCTQRRREEIVSRFPGRVKVLIVGNHDTSGKMYKSPLWTAAFKAEQQPVFWGCAGVPMLLSHRPFAPPPGWHGVCLYGHVHEKGTLYHWTESALRVCVCVELTEYRPVNILDILEAYHRGPGPIASNDSERNGLGFADVQTRLQEWSEGGGGGCEPGWVRDGVSGGDAVRDPGGSGDEGSS